MALAMGDGKDKLRQRLKEKRHSEGLGEIPDDLFEKKPRYEMSKDEIYRNEERRKRNKEAAEKSRKKKKEEFERLLLENDQLTQDKCDLTAVIQNLKMALQEHRLANEKLQLTNESLKRWIAKRANELGLGKHFYKDLKTKHQGAASTAAAAAATTTTPDRHHGDMLDASEPILRGDPSFHNEDSHLDRDDVTTRLCPPPRTPTSADALPLQPDSSASLLEVGSDSTQLLETPCLAEHGDVSSVDEHIGEAGETCTDSSEEQIVIQGHVDHPDEGTVYYEPACEGGEEDGQVVYLSPGTILVVHDDQQVTSSTSPHHSETPELSSSISNAMAVLNGDVGDAVVHSRRAEVKDMSADTQAAIETLLKQGFKIEIPSSSLGLLNGVLQTNDKRDPANSSDKGSGVQVDFDHNYRTGQLGMGSHLQGAMSISNTSPTDSVQTAAPGASQVPVVPRGQNSLGQYITVTVPVTG